MKCFITKFPFSTGNAELPYVNGLRVTIPKVSNPDYRQRSFTLGSKDSNSPITVEVNNGHIVDQTNFTSNEGTKITFAGEKSFVFSNDDAWIDIYPKENIIYFQDYFGSNNNASVMSYDLSELRVKTLNNFNWSYSKVYGDIGNLKYVTDMSNLNLNLTQVSGDISVFSNFTNIISMRFSNTQVSGDISAISNLVNLQNLDLSNTQVSGNVDNLAGLTKLVDLSGLNGLSLTGDMSKIPINVAFISQSGRKITTNFTWTANGRQNAKLLAMEGPVPFDTTSMDNMLIDQATCTFNPVASMPWYSVIKVSGIRTSASDAAVATLQSKGVTITGVTKAS